MSLTTAEIQAILDEPRLKLDNDTMGFGDASLARPGGNVTGASWLNTELSAKRLELLKEALPKVTRVAVPP